MKRLNAITDKRPATVILHILEHGSITTEELERLYGYKHPPRAIRDVRERGINIKTFRVQSSDGRSIGVYSFGDPLFITDSTSKVAGRTTISKAIKKALIDKFGPRCAVYNQEMDERLLQVDHRIPYEIGGEHIEKNDSARNTDVYMLLSPSANRAKSWTCEHCQNWTLKDPDFCIGCFWAYPENYDHIAGKKEKHLIITFTGDEINDYNQLIKLVGTEKAESTIKNLINNFVHMNGDDNPQDGDNS